MWPPYVRPQTLKSGPVDVVMFWPGVDDPVQCVISMYSSHWSVHWFNGIERVVRRFLLLSVFQESATGSSTLQVVPVDGGGEMNGRSAANLDGIVPTSPCPLSDGPRGR